EILKNVARLCIHAPWDRNCLGSKIPGIGVDETAIGKDGPAGLFNDRKTYFDGRAGHCLAADRLIVRIFRSDIAKSETAQIIRATEIQTIIDWDIRHFRWDVVYKNEVSHR